MEIVTWNIQTGRGVDGRFDLNRIADAILGMADPDVICFQEVSRFMPSMDGGAGLDQVHTLAARFPHYTPVYGAAVDSRSESGGRQQFGNLILSRAPVLQCFRHLLPLPPAPELRQMARQATEVVVECDGAVVRVVTTHLAFHSAIQRHAQAEYLLALQQEICDNAAHPPKAVAQGCYANLPRPGSAVLCGDFNFLATDPAYALLTSHDGVGLRFKDAWKITHGDTPHAATCGIFDHEQWPTGADCRDFFFVTEDLAAGVESVMVNADTDASDHQPLSLVVQLRAESR